MTVKFSRYNLSTGSPVQKIYSGRFTGINGAAPTTYKLDDGVTVSRSGEGVWVVTLPSPVKQFKCVMTQAIDNDGKYHDCHHTLDASARTITITHRNATLSAGLGAVAVSAELTDVSAASSAFVAAPCAGTISSIRTVLHSAITGADANLTTEINGTLVTDSAIVVAQSGSAAGDRDSATPSAANTVAQGDAIELISDGASSTTARLTATYVITPTAVAAEDVVDEISFIAIVELADVPGAGI